MMNLIWADPDPDPGPRNGQEWTIFIFSLIVISKILTFQRCFLYLRTGKYLRYGTVLMF